MYVVLSYVVLMLRVLHFKSNAKNEHLEHYILMFSKNTEVLQKSVVSMLINDLI